MKKNAEKTFKNRIKEYTKKANSSQNFLKIKTNVLIVIESI